MSKYKVGDTVKVREDLKPDDFYGSIKCLSPHIINRGKAHTITAISSGGNYHLDDGYIYSEEMLEDVMPQHICCDFEQWIHQFDDIHKDGVTVTCDFNIKGEDIAKQVFNATEYKPVSDCGKNLFDSGMFVTTTEYGNNIKNKEEKEMNKVVDLWFERKQKKIVDKYNKLEKEYIESIEIVKKYNELIDKFNKDLEELYKEDSVNEYQVLEEYDDETDFKYILDTSVLHFEASNEYIDKKQEELQAIKDTKDEVEALLSLSDNLDYQEEVLTRYNIITKKTKKISE